MFVPRHDCRGLRVWLSKVWQNVKRLLRKSLWLNVAGFSLWTALVFGQSPDARDSLAACNSGLQACEASRTVSPRLPAAAASSTDQKSPGPAELSDRLVICTNGWETCEVSLLAQGDLNSTEHQRNVSDCRNGAPTCNRAKLTPQEATALAVADYKRNVSDCTDGFASCDRSRL